MKARDKVQLYHCGNMPEYTAGACLLDSLSVDDMSQVRKVNDQRQAWTHGATFPASGLRENGPWRGHPGILPADDGGGFCFRMLSMWTNCFLGRSTAELANRSRRPLQVTGMERRGCSMLILCELPPKAWRHAKRCNVLETTARLHCAPRPMKNMQALGTCCCGTVPLNMVDQQSRRLAHRGGCRGRHSIAQYQDPASKCRFEHEGIRHLTSLSAPLRP